MSGRWFSGIIAGWLVVSNPVFANEPLPSDPLPLDMASFLVPQTPKTSPDRPTELPNIDPRTDLPPLVRPPANPSAPPTRPFRRLGPRSDYDPSFLYLPERNPGLRQPPCPCLPLGRWWANADYFLGITENAAIPTLAAVGGSGIPGTQGVSALHANERLVHSFRSGFRLETGTWIDRCQNWGVEGSFFFLESSRAAFGASSAGDTVLARPFIAQPGNVPSATMIAGPGVGSGSVSVNSPIDFFGADIDGRLNLFCEDRWRFDFLAGYRFLRMSEGASVLSHRISTVGSIQDVTDSFSTTNVFNGGQIGAATEYRWDRIFFSGSGKIAFGLNTHEQNISGATRTDGATALGGFLTRPSNLGVTSGSNYAVVPEANFRFGYQIADHWRASIGYTFIYLSSVARPGQLIDSNIGAAVTGIVHPFRNDSNSEFWLHGLNFGIEARY